MQCEDTARVSHCRPLTVKCGRATVKTLASFLSFSSSSLYIYLQTNSSVISDPASASWPVITPVPSIPHHLTVLVTYSHFSHYPCNIYYWPISTCSLSDRLMVQPFHLSAWCFACSLDFCSFVCPCLVEFALFFRSLGFMTPVCLLTYNIILYPCLLGFQFILLVQAKSNQNREQKRMSYLCGQ